MRRAALALFVLVPLCACVAEKSAHAPRSHSAPHAADQRAGAYASPYSTRFNEPVKALLADILSGPRGNREAESRFSREDWDSARVRRDYGAWGPPARRYPAPRIAQGKSPAWKRERLLATALLFTGLSYQHHHIPDWTPPEDWPWLRAPRGHNEKGLDCSNFTSFAYNLALGIQLSSDIGVQARTEHVEEGAATQARVLRIEPPRNFEGWPRVLKPGDLLFIKASPTGQVSHVVLWMGENGVSPDGTPLVLDSTGTGHKDANGAAIPDGIRLRPFSSGSWYFRCASHALRIIGDQ